MELSYVTALQAEKGGFNFENVNRNKAIMKASNGCVPLLKTVKKTGTTICGVVTKDSVVLGADTRATFGEIVADKNCQKLHRLADNIWTAGAGGAADLDHTTFMFESKMALEHLFTGRQCRVASVVAQLSQMLFQYQGHIQAALVLGGVDCKGPQLFKIHPHGSVDKTPFCAMGSGSLNAMAVLEAEYKDDMTVDEGKALVAAAIRAGIFNDLGSGGNVDLLVINMEGKAELLRQYDEPNPRLFRNPKPVTFNKGTTPVISEKIQSLRQNVIVETVDVEMRDQ